MLAEIENEHTSPPLPLPDDTDDEDDNNVNGDQDTSDEDENEGTSETQRSNKQQILKILQTLKGKFSYVTKDSKKRTRGYLQCNYICQSGPLNARNVISALALAQKEPIIPIFIVLALARNIML